MTILVTGVAGFIGFHVARRLISEGQAVVGIDNLNAYYTPALKEARLRQLRELKGAFEFHHVDIADEGLLGSALKGLEIDRIVHLAAQVGVRYSLENPRAYAHSNLIGHLNLLELARERRVAHLVYASSSSVYGGNEALPFATEDRTDRPISLYAATKKADELMSESYAHLYRLPQTGLRFFTVYGPWGRPDMAMWLFTDAIHRGGPLRLFNQGLMRRDFTYIDDVVDGVIACLGKAPADDGAPKAGGSVSPHAIYNLGNNCSEELMRVVRLIEQCVGREARLEYLPMQPGDVLDTFADISAIAREHGYAPRTSIDHGVPRFVEWYMDYAGRA